MNTWEITVKGLVQGIGYRPFAAELAEQLHITGCVQNEDGIVTLLATGERKQLEELVRRLEADAPSGAWVQSVQSKERPLQKFDGFAIAESIRQQYAPDTGWLPSEEKEGIPVLPPDLPTCDRCAEELHDKENRRYHHPFISCTSCGPRYSIMEEIPYDREHISMKKFPLCPKCEAEYRMQGGIRRHAQTIACKDCGPTLYLTEISADCEGKKLCKAELSQQEKAITCAIDHLKRGGILAIKDIGGYHLAAMPFSEDTVQGLRQLKGREKKPFAVMFPDVDTVREYCSMDEKEEQLLLQAARPIVLLKKKSKGSSFCSSVCHSSPDVGVMLPCNPVQILLTEAVGPLIMTSANVSGELLITEDGQMMEWMKTVAGKRSGISFDAEDMSEAATPSPEMPPLAVLSHDRPIVTPLDDSIVRMVCGKKQTLRRARGMVPEPIPFPSECKVLAAGGDLKSCFCYTGDGKAYLSQHLGDLYEESCYRVYQKELARMKRLFGFCPDAVVCDKHPGYRSADYFLSGKIDVPDILQIQHHKAHVASVIAEHDLKGAVLGFAFDGTGYGDDGTIWGSEVFAWDGWNMERRAHLKPVMLIGGDEGAKNADTILYGYLASFSEETLEAALVQLEKGSSFSEERFRTVQKAVRLHINCVQSTSMGRLFDAVSAFLDICHYNSYEGEAAIELENLAATAAEAYPLHLTLVEDAGTGELYIDTEPLFCGMTEALRQNVHIASIACGFIHAISDVIVDICGKLRNPKSDSGKVTRVDSEQGAKSGLGQIAGTGAGQIVLSGGTFLNRILLERVTEKLEACGYAVYRNELIPPGDGGICLGQAYLAARHAEQKRRICNAEEIFRG